MPATTDGVATAAAAARVANSAAHRTRIRRVISAPYSSAENVMPARTVGDATAAAVAVAANSAAHRRRIRPGISGSFHGGHLPPPLLRRNHQPRIIRPHADRWALSGGRATTSTRTAGSSRWHATRAVGTTATTAPDGPSVSPGDPRRRAQAQVVRGEGGDAGTRSPGAGGLLQPDLWYTRHDVRLGGGRP